MVGFNAQDLTIQPKGGKLVHLIYLDEAGNTGNNLNDLTQPIHFVAATIIQDSEWLNLEAQVNLLIDKYVLNPFDREKFEFHASDLYQGRGYFSKWDRGTRMQILDDLLDIVVRNKVPIIYGSVHKQKLKAQYRYPSNPHDLAFLFCAERVEGWFVKEAPFEVGMFIADETKAKHDMKKSLRLYRTAGIPLGHKGIRLGHIIDTIHFADSRESFGIQLTDVCNYFIKRKEEGKSKTDAFYKKIENNIYSGMTFP